MNRRGMAFLSREGSLITLQKKNDGIESTRQYRIKSRFHLFLNIGFHLHECHPGTQGFYIFSNQTDGLTLQVDFLCTVCSSVIAPPFYFPAFKQPAKNILLSHLYE